MQLVLHLTYKILVARNTMHANVVSSLESLADYQALLSPWYHYKIFKVFYLVLQFRQERETKGWWLCREVTHESSIVSDSSVSYCLFIWNSITVSTEVEDSYSTCSCFIYWIISHLFLPLLTSKNGMVNSGIDRSYDSCNWNIHCKISWRSKADDGKLYVKIFWKQRNYINSFIRIW